MKSNKFLLFFLLTPFFLVQTHSLYPVKVVESPIAKLKKEIKKLEDENAKLKAERETENAKLKKEIEEKDEKIKELEEKGAPTKGPEVSEDVMKRIVKLEEDYEELAKKLVTGKKTKE